MSAALSICDEQGLHALSLRRIGARVGSGAASLYWHVASKEQLLDLVLDEVFGLVELPERPSRSWRKDVRDVAHTVRTTFLAHPFAISLATARPASGPHALGLVERWLAALARGGFRQRELFFAHSVVASYVMGVIAAEVSWTVERTVPQVTNGIDADTLDAGAFAYLQQATAGMPHLSAAIPYLLAHDRVAQFDFGLDVILSGLAARAS